MPTEGEQRDLVVETVTEDGIAALRFNNPEKLNAWSDPMRDAFRVALAGARPGERVLDACAAPGGKALALRYDAFAADAVAGEAISLDWSVDAQNYRGLTASAGAYQAWNMAIADMPVQLGVGLDYRHRFDLRCDLLDHVEASGRRVVLGVTRIEPIHIREQHQMVRADGHSDLRGQAVIVAKAYFVGRNRVVLVYDRHHPQRQKR